MKFDRISDPYVSITLTLPDFRKDNAQCYRITVLDNQRQKPIKENTSGIVGKH